MFASSEFRPPQAPRPPLTDNRFVGLVILGLALALIMALSIYADRSVFIPFAPTYAITQTAQAKASPTPGKSTPSSAPVRPPSDLPTLTPMPGEQVSADQG